MNGFPRPTGFPRPIEATVLKDRQSRQGILPGRGAPRSIVTPAQAGTQAARRQVVVGKLVYTWDVPGSDFRLFAGVTAERNHLRTT